jgi:hypothetical protein
MGFGGERSDPRWETGHAPTTGEQLRAAAKRPTMREISVERAW